MKIIGLIVQISTFRENIVYLCLMDTRKIRLRIRDLREDRDLTQVYIAKILKCDNSLYSKYERGERDIPLRIAVKLAKYYNVSVDYLVGISDDPAPKEPCVFSDKL